MCGCICQWGGGDMVWVYKAVVKSGLRIPSLRSSPILYVYNRAQMPLIPLMLDDNKRPSGLSLWDLWPWDIFYFYPLHQNNCTLITWGQEGLALQMQDNFFISKEPKLVIDSTQHFSAHGFENTLPWIFFLPFEASPRPVSLLLIVVLSSCSILRYTQTSSN